MKHPLRLRSLSRPLRFSLALAALAACMVAHETNVPSGTSSTEARAAMSAPAAVAGETLLLQDPTVSAHHVVFRYAEDLWVADRTGGDARRLTSSPGSESNPQLSPDGKLVAFTGQYEGNPDVYVMSVEGGAPRRLTWHPGADVVLDWHPDGSGIVFSSAREATNRTAKAFFVPVGGGPATAFVLPKVARASLDEDASHFAYTPIGDAFGTWKRYRGGRITSVWIFDRASHEVEVVPHVNASDTFPRWLGGNVYFASDRDGVMNLYRYTPGGGNVEQLTRYGDFHVRSLDTGGGVAVFEQAGSLHLFDPMKNEVEDIHIRVQTDGLYSVPRWQDVSGHVRAASIAPNGKRAVFEARGEIITIPREHGDARNLSNSPGVHDRSPVWSPDGESIAWFSDEGGEYRLVVRDRRGRGEAKFFALGGAGFYYDPAWSPDGKHLLYSDKANQLAYLTVETGAVTNVASVQGSLGVLQPQAVWSPNSKWIAYVDRNTRTLYDHLVLFELASGTATPVTDDFAASSSPAFSRDGKYLYFFATVDRGPSFMGLNMATSAARDWSGNLYFAVLQADGENPLFPKSDDAVEAKKDDDDDAKKEADDEEPAEEASPAADDDNDRDDEAVAAIEDEEPSPGDEEGEDEEEDAGPGIDIEGLDQRILALPLPGGRYGNLQCTDDGLLFIEQTPAGTTALKSFSFDLREAKSLKDGVQGFAVSGDGKSLLTSAGGGFAITNATGGDPKSLAINAVKVRVEPVAEWAQTLREVWRIERDYFYDENMHGVDWPAMWERWKAFLPHVQHRSDLNLLQRELIGELACGHEYTGGGETPDGPAGISVGLLGADFEIADGKYRIARILRGQNWNPGLRAPLTEPGVDAREGDYLLAVNDRPLDAGQNLYQAFEYTAEKQVDLTLSATADGAESRTVTVVPIRGEGGLRFQSWVEDNRRRVDELSGGRLAYIYMPNTAGAGMAAFDRDFYSQLDKHGVILDERYNGGGQVADYIIDALSREVMSYWMNREKWLGRSPSGVMDGPKVMIINEYAGSGGDWMPWAFQNRKVGKLVGTRTWGGLVGISGYPPLMDGGTVTAASFGVMDTDGKWAVENVGVSPDVEVIEWPADVIAGHDPQLERAVQVALDVLKAKAPQTEPVYYPPTER